MEKQNKQGRLLRTPSYSCVPSTKQHTQYIIILRIYQDVYNLTRLMNLRVRETPEVKC